MDELEPGKLYRVGRGKLAVHAKFIMRRNIPRTINQAERVVLTFEVIKGNYPWTPGKQIVRTVAASQVDHYIKVEIDELPEEAKASIVAAALRRDE